MHREVHNGLIKRDTKLRIIKIFLERSLDKLLIVVFQPLYACLRVNLRCLKLAVAQELLHLVNRHPFVQ